MLYRQSAGRWGERLAIRTLLRKRYILVGRNVHYREGEIDLVMRDGDELVFVEVKLRTSRMYGEPDDAIDENKLARLSAAAARYCAEREYDGAMRIDAVCITIDARAMRAYLNHIRDVSSADDPR